MSASSSNSREVPLPESVETILRYICQRQSQPPIKNYARRLLAEIDEKASMDILAMISSQRIYSSFSGYISTLVKKYYPAEASRVLSDFQSSPTSFGSAWSPSSASPFSSPQNRSMEISRFFFSFDFGDDQWPSVSSFEKFENIFG